MNKTYCIILNQVLNRTMESHHGNRSQNHHNRTPLIQHMNNPNQSHHSATPQSSLPLISQMPNSIPSPSTVLPQQLITAGTRKDCIRLRGLPYTAQVEHILDFLGEYAKHIVVQGVHMVYNNQVSFVAHFCCSKDELENITFYFDAVH